MHCRASAFRLPPSAFRPSALPSPCSTIVLRRAGGDDVAALLARLGPQVDHPVGRLDHVEVVLDHHHRVAQIDQPVEHVEQLGQIVEVQAGGRLVEQVERPAGVGPGKLGGQLDPLGLAAGERRGRLAEREVVEPHVAERLQQAANLGDVLEQLDRLAARHVQHVGDRTAVVADGQRFGIVAPAAAGVALDPHVGQEVHLDAELPVAFALLAPPAGHVEAEPPRRVAAELRLGQLGVERADQVEHAGERGRVRGRRLPQRLLIDADHLVDQLHAADGVVGAGKGLRAVQRAGQRGEQHVLDQRALAAAADAGDHGERAQRNLHGDVLQVVVPCADDLQPAAGRNEGRRERGDGEAATSDAAIFRSLFSPSAFSLSPPLPSPLSPASAGSSARESPSCRRDTAR